MLMGGRSPGASSSEPSSARRSSVGRWRGTMRIFSSAEWCRRVFLRMSRTVFSALSGMRLLACLIVAPRWGYESTASDHDGAVRRPKVLLGKHRRDINFDCHVGPRQLADHQESRSRNRSVPEGFPTTFQGVLKEAHIRRVGHDAHKHHSL